MTEEVWVLAASMSMIQALATVFVVFGIGYAALYKADGTHDAATESEFGGVPLRFVSLMCVSFGSVTVLALLFDAPATFLEGSETTAELVVTTIKAISVGSVFSVVGAATADSVFSK